LFLGAALLSSSLPTRASWARQRANILVQRSSEIIGILRTFRFLFQFDQLATGPQRVIGKITRFLQALSFTDFTLKNWSVESVAIMAIPVVVPITGIVWKILVDVGEEVTLDQPVVLLESMKMEVPVCAPVAGTIRSIAATEGASVEDGDTLATIVQSG